MPPEDRVMIEWLAVIAMQAIWPWCHCSALLDECMMQLVDVPGRARVAAHEDA
jgi:hypothetical protein